MEASQEEVVQLTQDLVRIESCNPGPCEGAMGDFVFDWFQKQGIAVVRDEVQPGRNNIVAKLEGEIADPALVFICHMDTVPLGEDWTSDPLDPWIQGDRMSGRGSSDMKSASPRRWSHSATSPRPAKSRNTLFIVLPRWMKRR